MARAGCSDFPDETQDLKEFGLLCGGIYGLRIGVNDVTLKNTTRVEITITIDTAILIKNNKKLCSYFRAIFFINCDYNFNSRGIFGNMTSFTPILNQDLEQGKLMAAVNSR